MRRGQLFALGFPLLLLAFGACKHKTEAAVPPPAEVVLRDDSSGLLLTWVDEKGVTSVVEKPADVPIVGRDAVRVVDPNREDPPDTLYLADLRQPRPDGTYSVHAAKRSEFDALIAERRSKSGLTLEKAAAEGQAEARAAEEKPVADSSRPQVIIYGAEWCGACHEAAAYLRKHGIPFIEKDVDKDEHASKEMQAKLAKSGNRGGSIPVIDVRGHVFVGFNPAQIEAALKAG